MEVYDWLNPVGFGILIVSACPVPMLMMQAIIAGQDELCILEHLLNGVGHTTVDEWLSID